MARDPLIAERAIHRMHLVAKQLFVFVTCFSLVLQSTPIPAVAQGFGLPGMGGGGQSPEPSSPIGNMFGTPAPDPTPAPAVPPADSAPVRLDATDLTSAKDLIESISQARNALAGPDLPRPPSVETVRRTVGKDPRALADWVQTRIGLLPYRDSLKATESVLLEGEANALDRALLLAALMKPEASNIRLIQYSVSEAGRRALFAQYLNAKTQPTAWPASVADPGAAVEPDTRLLQAARDRLQALPNQTVDEIWQTLLDKGVETAGSQNTETLVQQQLDAFKVYYGLRFTTSEGNADLIIDEGILRAEDLIEIGEVAPEKVIGGLVHAQTVRFEFDISVLRDGQVRKETLLSHVFTPAEMQEDTILFSLEPFDGTITLPSTPSRAATNTFLNEIKTLPGFAPTLRFGGKTVSDRGLSFLQGPIPKDRVKQRLGPIGAGVDSAARGITGALDGITRGSSTMETDNVVVAAHMRLTLNGAEGAKAISRRIFDLRGPSPWDVRGTVSAEAAARALTSADYSAVKLRILPAFDTFRMNLTTHRSNPSVLAQEISQFLSLAESVTAARQHAEPIPEETLTGLARFSAHLSLYEYIRSSNSQMRSRLFLAEPNIAIERLKLRMRPDNGFELSEGVAIDIVSNEVAPIPVSDASPFQMRLRQGIVDSVSETIALAGAFSDGVWSSVPTEITAAVLIPTPSALVRAGSISPHARTTLDAQFSEGRIAILEQTDRNTHARWWSVDARSGTTVSSWEGGTGGAFKDYLVTIVATGGMSFIVCAGLSIVSNTQCDSNNYYMTGSQTEKCAWLALIAAVVALVPVAKFHAGTSAAFAAAEGLSAPVAYSVGSAFLGSIAGKAVLLVYHECPEIVPPLPPGKFYGGDKPPLSPPETPAFGYPPLDPIPSVQLSEPGGPTYPGFEPDVPRLDAPTLSP